MIRMHRSLCVKAGSVKWFDNAIVIEDRFELLLNNCPVGEIVATRDQLRELGAGHVIGEGLAKQIDSVSVEGDRILVCSGNGCDPKQVRRETGSSGGTGFNTPVPFVSSGIRITLEEVMTVSREIETELWKKTGGVHCSVLYSEGHILAKSSDIGRHNTVDKIVGYAVLNNIDLSRCVIGCTGRQPSGMVRKSARAGIPVIISKAASTDKGIAVAEEAGVTLIAFSRGERFTVYTHPERIDIRVPER